MKYVVLDTMVFLHWPPVQDLDWPAYVGTAPVCLVISDPVVRELDRHKDQHPSSKIRDRARRALKQIEQWGSTGSRVSLRKDVELEIWLHHPQVDWSELALDKTWLDDQVLAVAKSLSVDRAPGSVVIATGDTGPRLKAKRLGLEAIDLPQDRRLPLDEDPLASENRKLKERLAQLSQRPAPDLRVEFDGDLSEGSRLHFIVPPPLSPEDRKEWVQQKMLEQRSKHRPYENPLSALAQLSGDPTMVQDVSRYNEELDDYFRAYATYLEEVADYQEWRRLFFQLEFKLCNVGQAPAEDIDVTIHIPSGPFVSQTFDSKGGPPEPKLPRAPQTMMQRLASLSTSPRLGFDMSSIVGAVGPRDPRNVSGPRIKETESYDIEFSVRKLKHAFCTDLGGVDMWFNDETAVSSMSLSYWIHAANMPEAEEGTLHIVFDRT